MQAPVVYDTQIEGDCYERGDGCYYVLDEVQVGEVGQWWGGEKKGVLEGV